MSTTPTPFQDHATPILQGDPALSDAHRADLWDIFHNSKNPDELAQHLQPMTVPDETKQALVEAKQKSTPPRAPLDKATAAISQLAQMDPKVLDLAESHPNVLKTLTSAATIEPKAATEPASASKDGGKGRISPKAEKPPSVQPDVPATPSGHALVHATDGGFHHIPLDQIDKARTLDPKMTILHVEP